ncbi:hypothetical protein OG203_37890 [Nocardia sp. NBC_01499]|uniref:hypothetical protein n=1 Tax=Nocardia sp. NBC_01499 TaxID=2903597 RepID=UPI0038631353
MGKMVGVGSVGRWVWLAGVGVVVNVGVLGGLYLPGGVVSLRAPYAERVFWVPFAIAFVSGMLALRAVIGRWFGRASGDQVRELWGELSVGVRTGFVVVYSGAMAQVGLSIFGRGVASDIGFERAFAGIGVALSACAAALLYAAKARERRGTRLPPVPARKWLWLPRIAVVVVVAVGLVVYIASDRHSIFDERSLHERLAADYGHTVWYSHVVAANTNHSADGFAVYLDTTDPAIQTAACTDLLGEGKLLGRMPNLWFADHGHGRYVRPC